MVKDLSLLCEKLGRKLGHSKHIFRISGRGSENHIYDEYHRGAEPAVPKYYQNKAVVYK